MNHANGAPSGLIAALAEELERTPPYSLILNGGELLQIVSFLQLALRHPALDEEAHESTQYVRAFIASARAGFGGFPTVQLVIDKNDGDGMETRPC